MVFGANWCPDCVELHKQLASSLKSVIENDYIVVNVDVGIFLGKQKRLTP